MNWWQILLLVLASNWVVPLVVCWAYGLFGWIKGDFVPIGWYGPFPIFRLSRHVAPWHARAWRDWGGVGLMGFMVVRNEPGPDDDAWVARTKVHEGTHCYQWLMLGGLFYAVYLGHMAYIYWFKKDLHPYLDCWFEREARRRAGQLVDVPREQWPDGPKDRWPWW